MPPFAATAEDNYRLCLSSCRLHTLQRSCRQPIARADCLIAAPAGQRKQRDTAMGAALKTRQQRMESVKQCSDVMHLPPTRTPLLQENLGTHLHDGSTSVTMLEGRPPELLPVSASQRWWSRGVTSPRCCPACSSTPRGVPAASAPSTSNPPGTCASRNGDDFQKCSCDSAVRVRTPRC